MKVQISVVVFDEESGNEGRQEDLFFDFEELDYAETGDTVIDRARRLVREFEEALEQPAQLQLFDGYGLPVDSDELPF